MFGDGVILVLEVGLDKSTALGSVRWLGAVSGATCVGKVG